MYLVLIIRTFGLMKRHMQITGQSKVKGQVHKSHSVNPWWISLVPQEPVQHQVWRWVCKDLSAHVLLTQPGSWVPARSKPQASSVAVLLFLLYTVPSSSAAVELARAIKPWRGPTLPEGRLAPHSQASRPQTGAKAVPLGTRGGSSEHVNVQVPKGSCSPARWRSLLGDALLHQHGM